MHFYSPVYLRARSPGLSVKKLSDFDRLLRAVCVQYGFCGSLQDGGSLHVTDFIPERGKVSVEQFIGWLYMAEGEKRFRSPSHVILQEKLRSCFIGYMGSDIVSAYKLGGHAMQGQRILDSYADAGDLGVTSSGRMQPSIPVVNITESRPAFFVSDVPTQPCWFPDDIMVFQGPKQ